MVTDDAAYAAFGRVIASSGSTENDFDWSAEPQLRRDPDTGYIHARRRDYDALITRFLNPDPKAFDSGDPNFYRYAGNNPVNDADPSGLQGGRAPVNSRGLTHNQPTKSAGPVRPPDTAGRIAATRVDELVTQGAMSYFRGTDREYAVMVDACGDSIRAVVLKRYSFISVGRSSARYEHYQPVMNHPVLDLGIAQKQGTNIPEYIGRLRTRRSSDQYVELYLGQKETERLQWWASASEFALHAVPFGGTIDNVMQGNYGEAALSLAGDVAFFLTGGASLGARLGGAATKAGTRAFGSLAAKEIALGARAAKYALILEGGVGAVRFGQGLYAMRNDETGDAAGYFGEAFLALVGVGGATLRRYRKAGDAAQKAGDVAPASKGAHSAGVPESHLLTDGSREARGPGGHRYILTKDGRVAACSSPCRYLSEDEGRKVIAEYFSTPPVIPAPGTGVTDDAVEALAKARSAGTKAVTDNVAPKRVWTKATSEYINETRHAFEKSGGVREQFWKNEFAKNRNAYTPQNQALIKQGKAPFGTDGKPMVLHHKTPIEYGGTNDFSNLQPMRYRDHSLSPNFGPLHTPPFSE